MLLKEPPPAEECREYFPAWQRVRDTGSVRLKVAPHLVARVRKAVIKEKYNDLSFKVQHEYSRHRMIIRYNAETWILSFTLVKCKTIRGDEL